MNTLTYKDGKLELIVDGTEISEAYIVDPMYVKFSASELPKVSLEVIINEVNIEDFKPLLSPIDYKTLAEGSRDETH